MTKAISIKQPWASMICMGLKDVENRTWLTHYRGRIFIHASQKADARFKQASANRIFTAAQQVVIPKKDGLLCIPSLAFSSIIGEAVITDCVQNSKSIWAELGLYHWVIERPVLYDMPVRCNGSLSFWLPPLFEASAGHATYKSY